MSNHNTDRNPAPARGRRPKLSALTPRELEVLALVADGWRSLAIATELGIRESTVKTHLIHIYGKLGVSNRVEAATRYTRAKAAPQRRAGR